MRGGGQAHLRKPWDPSTLCIGRFLQTGQDDVGDVQRRGGSHAGLELMQGKVGLVSAGRPPELRVFDNEADESQGMNKGDTDAAAVWQVLVIG